MSRPAVACRRRAPVAPPSRPGPSYASVEIWNGHALGHGGPGIDDVVPALDVGKVGQVHLVPLVPRRPREDRHVGDGVVGAPGEGSRGQLLVEYTIEPLCLIDVALDAVFDL